MLRFSHKAGGTYSTLAYQQNTNYDNFHILNVQKSTSLFELSEVKISVSFITLYLKHLLLTASTSLTFCLKVAISDFVARGESES